MRRKVNRLISSGVDFEPKLVWGDLHQQKEVRLLITSTCPMAHRFNKDHMGKNRSVLPRKRIYLGDNK